MCRFKSGIILKTRCVVADGVNDSHSDLLDGLGIEDTEINAMTKFVRVELLPPNNEWWTDPDRWKINIDQDILPDWYKEDKEKYNEDFRKEVKEWCNKHVLVDKNIRELKEGYYLLKDCDVETLANNAVVVLYNATVKRMYDNATVERMYDNATVERMYGNATVKRMYDNATVQEMYGNATVQEMYGNATVQEMYGNATVQEMYGNATVHRMYGNATVQEMYGNATVQEMYDNATVERMNNNAMVQEMNDNATVKRMNNNATVKRMNNNATVKRMFGDSKAFSYKEAGKIKAYVSAESCIEVVVHSGGEA